MSLGYFSYPAPVNEPVLDYAPGSPERTALKKVLAELKSEEMDIPMYIGGEEIRTGNSRSLRMPLIADITFLPVKLSAKHGHCEAHRQIETGKTRGKVVVVL